MSIVFIISAPSGSGKVDSGPQAPQGSTGPHLLCLLHPPRRPRGLEQDGPILYHFISREEFETRVARGEFLEHADVFWQ